MSQNSKCDTTQNLAKLEMWQKFKKSIRDKTYKNSKCEKEKKIQMWPSSKTKKRPLKNQKL